MANAQTVRTNDGRTLAYAEAGQPDGAPVFYCHGTPGTRNDFEFGVNRPALDGVGLRVIGIDRPGFGDSTFAPKRTYADWPRDVASIADHLGIERFGVIGYSAGGPYAIACALAYPDRLTFVGVVSGDGPSETPNFRKGMGATDAAMSRIARWAPVVGRLAIGMAAKQARAKPEKFSATFDKELSEPDLKLHRDPEMRQTVRDIFLESTRNGPRGVVEDYRVWGKPSGLDLTAVRTRVRIWHGDADHIVPLHHAEYVAEQIPNAELTVLPGVGHLHTAAQWHAILLALAGAIASE